MPHSRIQVELGFILQAGTCHILNFAQNPIQSQRVQGTELNWEGGAPHIFSEQGANRGGGHRTYFFEGVTIGFWENHILGGWGHRTYFVGVGTPQILCQWGGDTAQHRKNQIFCFTQGGDTAQH